MSFEVSCYKLFLRTNLEPRVLLLLGQRWGRREEPENSGREIVSEQKLDEHYDFFVT